MDPTLLPSFKEAALRVSSEFLKGRKDLRGVDVLNDWRFLLTKDHILDGVQKCADYINRNFEGKEIAVACILKGAVPFCDDLTERLMIPYNIYYIQASSYHNSQTQGQEIEVLSVINPAKFQEKEVILLDELFDNGFTLHSVKEHLVKSGVPREKIMTVTLFKKDRAVPDQYDSPDFCGLIVPDVWLVGYGLDDRQEKRGWKVLYACPKAPGVPKSKGDEIFESDLRYMEECLKIVEQLREELKECQ